MALLNGLTISEVRLSEIEDISKRLDAEYYKPCYLHDEQKLLKTHWKFLEKLSRDIKSFGAYSLCNLIEYKNNGIPFLRCQNIKNGLVDFTDVLFIDKTANDLLWKSEVKPGTVLLAMSGSVGNAAVALDNWNYPVNSNQDIAKISTNEQLDPFYLTVFLNSHFGKLQTERLPIGSIQKHIFLWQLAKLVIPVFSPKFQSLLRSCYLRAVSFIDKANKSYSDAEHILLSELGLVDWQPTHQPTFVRNFSDFLQADRLDAEYFQPKYFQLKKQLSQTIKDKGWEVGELGTVSGKLKYGTSTKLTYLDSGIPFLRITDLSQYRFIPENLTYIAPHNAQTEPKVKTNDVLISRSGTLGLTVAIPKNLDGSVFGSYFIRIRPDTTRINPVYLALYLNSLIGKSQVEQSNTGAIQTNLTIPVIESILIALLPMKVQEEIAQNVLQSYDTQDQSKRLLEIAKHGVELAIEQDERAAEAWIQEQVELPAGQLQALLGTVAWGGDAVEDTERLYEL